MEDSWNCRGYQSGDEYQIITFNNEFNDRKMTSEHWKWKFAENPFGKAIIKLMFDGKELIAHRSAIPMVISIKGIAVSAALIANTITHPDYRRKGISSYLAEAVYEEARRRGIKFIYNFPNPNSYPLYLKIAGWESLGQRSAWQKQLRTQPAFTMPHSTTIVQVERFDHRANLLWDRVRQDYIVVLPRWENFLNWRFTEHQTNEYFKFIIKNAAEILGYLVLKIYTREDEIKGHIIDMLCINNRDIVKSLLVYSYNYFIEKGITRISCWMPENCFCAPVLKDEGFVSEVMETYFGLMILDRQDSLLQNVRHVGNWHLMMGDSDVF
ncbi:GNAT family N-acetyltransferase [Chloroflexota bacterium]